MGAAGAWGAAGARSTQAGAGADAVGGRGRGARQAGAARGRTSMARHRGAAGARGRGAWGERYRRCARGHALPGRAGGPAGCALGVLSLF